MSSISNVKISRRGHEYGVVHLVSPETASLKEIVIKYVQISEARFDELLWLGSIYYKDKRVIGYIEVNKGDYLRVHTNPRRYEVNSIIYPDLVLADEEDYIVIHKPSGISVHASVDNLHENALAILSQKMNVNLRVTSRLDVATEGLLVYAKTSGFQTKFNEYLANGKVKKIYRAIVHANQSLSLGRIVHYMEPSPRAPKHVELHPREGWQDCIMIILGVNPIDAESTEVFIELITGRTHQIRAQLSYMGCPILGDYQYGSAIRYSEAEERIKLQSYSLQFPNAPTYELTSSPLFKK
jgi:23S rRNA pseudouridine1911/1915/1917 synthase